MGGTAVNQVKFIVPRSIPRDFLFLKIAKRQHERKKFMKTVRISDVTLAREGLSFKEKLEIAKLLDKTNVDTVEFGKIKDEKVDLLALRTLSSTFASAIFSCKVGADKEETKKVAEALAGAKKARLTVSLPVSSVQMEYSCGKKPADMLSLIAESVSFARSLCSDVEFEALDASRGEYSFVCSAINAAIEAGASTVTVCDTAGEALPCEFGALIKGLKKDIPALSGICLAVSCSDNLKCANASLIEALTAGADEVKVSATHGDVPCIKALADAIHVKGDSLGLSIGLNVTTLGRTCEQIADAINDNKSCSAFDNKVGGDAHNVSLGTATDISTLRGIVEELGYELSDDDMVKVYDSFAAVAAKKLVTSRDLDAIVASVAVAVPPTYRLANYVITSGNLIGSTAHVILEKDNARLTGLSAGNGPVDAAFLALEQITGHHFELDDFQIQAVTEGREAVGEAIVRLRANGKLYSGRGVSTDIVGAGLKAYISALNKIVYEENF